MQCFDLHIAYTARRNREKGSKAGLSRSQLGASHAKRRALVPPLQPSLPPPSGSAHRYFHLSQDKSDANVHHKLSRGDGARAEPLVALVLACCTAPTLPRRLCRSSSPGQLALARAVSVSAVARHSPPCVARKRPPPRRSRSRHCHPRSSSRLSRNRQGTQAHW